MHKTGKARPPARATIRLDRNTAASYFNERYFFEDVLMKPATINSLLICLFGILLCHNACLAMTVELGSEGGDIISVGDTWRFFRGTKAPSAETTAWAQLDFDESDWEVGPSGFGYGDDDDATQLEDMRHNYVSVYIRNTFSPSSLPPDAMVELLIDYDDGFIAYLNGQEVARERIASGPVTHETRASSHEAGKPEIHTLGRVRDVLINGTNILAIEGHNISQSSSDFSLIPALRIASDATKNGETWIVETQTVALRGRTAASEASAVSIGDITVDIDSGDGTWTADVTLNPGMNTLSVEAITSASDVVDSGLVGIVYVPATHHASGELAEDVTWSGAMLVEETVTVPSQHVLTIEAGTIVLMREDAGINVFGQLMASGTENQPIFFTHYGDGTTWERIMFVEATDSRLTHCTIEYADCEGDHKRYYDNDCNADTPLPKRDYREAIVSLASHVDIEHCIFQHLPDDSSSPEGDAIAIISDDPDHPGDATARIMGCQFLSIGQGVHTRFSYVLVEDCYFTDHHGDNDDVDLYGESIPAPLIKNNLFLNPSHDDMINPTRCSAVIIGNIIAGCDDHGIVLRDKCHPILINNLIFDCSSAGIAVQNQCDALLINNTIVDCGRGIRFFDHTGRRGPPYCLFPGSGRATLVNCIIWDCSTPILLTDSPYEQDRGSHATVIHCNVEGGQDAASVSPHSTLTWGEGNMNEDPQFADAITGDFHLKSTRGRWDPSSQTWVVDDTDSPCIDAGTSFVVDDPNYAITGPFDWTGELWPHGKHINIGTYGGSAQASLSTGPAGHAADCTNDGMINAEDLKLLAEHWLSKRVPHHADINRDQRIDFLDLSELDQNWQWQE